MEPVRSLEYLLPVDHSLLYLSDRRMCTVIHYLARTCHSTCLKEIYTKAVSAVNTMLCAYSIAVEVLDAALRNVILWETGNEFRFDTIVCKRHCNVGLAATESSLKLFCL